MRATTVTEAAREVGCSPSTVRRLIRRRLLDYFVRTSLRDGRWQDVGPLKVAPEELCAALTQIGADMRKAAAAATVSNTGRPARWSS